MKRLLLLGLFSTIMPIDKEYNIRIKHEAVFADNNTKATRIDSVVVNGKHVKCHCGKDPVMILIVYGQAGFYCSKCVANTFGFKISPPK